MRKRARGRGREEENSRVGNVNLNTTRLPRRARFGCFPRYGGEIAEVLSRVVRISAAAFRRVHFYLFPLSWK